ncbi:UNVERIFIED_ORG: hypothetical protein M2438_002930 [Methylobacterium sp. SuP10 SLI 274]|nr:hypothetical protein [Methylorubrum extorquens]MDF9792474.1 hypothetical protein [Methylorubrum extorquens]MDF9864162.1 hypothetical protein [Methylorubrum pseudosasae]MDH6637755.1 hypothetical protein [Methylobacterium sp. SuP10 SLI 274]MDH6666934.1 hypothetical protein [Methylorubrum zatmanii]
MILAFRLIPTHSLAPSRGSALARAKRAQRALSSFPFRIPEA